MGFDKSIRTSKPEKPASALLHSRGYRTYVVKLIASRYRLSAISGIRASAGTGVAKNSTPPLPSPPPNPGADVSCNSQKQNICTQSFDDLFLPTATIIDTEFIAGDIWECGVALFTLEHRICHSFDLIRVLTQFSSLSVKRPLITVHVISLALSDLCQHLHAFDRRSVLVLGTRNP